MKTIELFSGTESFSKVARSRGHETFTVEIDNKNFSPDLCKNILEVQAEDLPKDIDILWASPPCTTFSVASLRHYWINGKPKNSKTWEGITFVLKTLELIKELKPKYWFIENPRGMLRKLDFMKKLHRNTVTYCQYGDFRQKPTDIWTNCKNWKPKPMCRPGAPCHESAKRGATTGSQGIGGGSKKGSILRAKIPKALLEEIFNIIENDTRNTNL